MELEEDEGEEKNEAMVDENLSLGAKIKVLSRDATSSQKIKIVRLVEEFQSSLDGKSPDQKDDLVKDLMDKIYKELSTRSK